MSWNQHVRWRWLQNSSVIVASWKLDPNHVFNVEVKDRQTGHFILAGDRIGIGLDGKQSASRRLSELLN